MSEVPGSRPEKLSFSAGSRATGLIMGLLIGGAGAAMVWFGLPGADATPEATGAIGAGLLAFGLICMILRGGTTIDRQAGTVTRWIGLLVPMYARTRSFEASAVHLSHEFYRRKGVTYHTYPIVLVTPEGDLLVGADDKVMPAWTLAPSIATFLDLDLIDDSNAAIDTGLVPSVIRAVQKRRNNRTHAPRPL